MNGAGVELQRVVGRGADDDHIAIDRDGVARAPNTRVVSRGSYAHRGGPLGSRPNGRPTTFLRNGLDPARTPGHTMTADDDTGEIARLLRDHDGQDASVIDHLFPLVYADLRRVAAARLGRDAADRTLNPTALVHEVYARFAKGDQHWNDRQHFFAAATRAMRQIIIDHARTKARDRRGGGAAHLTLDPSRVGSDGDVISVLELDDALMRLEAIDARLARVVEYRFFTGLTEEECGAVLGCTSRTVRRDWVKAKALLASLLDDSGTGE